MDTKTTSWVSYITFIGWIVAYSAGDKEGAKFYLNQSAIIWLGYLCLAAISALLIFIPGLGQLIAWAGNIFLIVMWIMGLIAAINQEEKKLPLIGKLKIL